MSQAKRMEGRRVVVTGAGTGIGRGVAVDLGKQGASVVLHYTHSSGGAESAVEEIERAGGKAKAIQADFREFEPLGELAEQAVSFLGGCDTLVNNAGITYNLPLEELEQSHFDTLMNVNVRAQIFLTQALLPALSAAEHGYVINFTSVHAFAAQTEHAIYAATKGAIVAYTRVLGLELIQKGVRVNAIAPGWIRVENHEKLLGEGFDWDAADRSLPTGFTGTPTDMAELVMFLASEESRYIVGQTIISDGGQLLIQPNSGDYRERREHTFGKQYV